MNRTQRAEGKHMLWLASRANAMRQASGNVAEHMRGVTTIVEANSVMAEQVERATRAITEAMAPVASDSGFSRRRRRRAEPRAGQSPRLTITRGTAAVRHQRFCMPAAK
jgi:hypothetical protein